MTLQGWAGAGWAAFLPHSLAVWLGRLPAVFELYFLLPAPFTKSLGRLNNSNHHMLSTSVFQSTVAVILLLLLLLFPYTRCCWEHRGSD